MKWIAVDEKQPMDRGVLPDVPVHHWMAEMLSGPDKEMSLALELARRGTQTEVR